MAIEGTISALRRVRVWLGHALLVAFVLRAVIPAGFMPVFSALDGGALKIVICTAHGTKVITADEGAAADTSMVAKHASDPCAFAPLIVLAAPDNLVASISPAMRQVPGPVRNAGEIVPPARAGPANGSRAPPSLA